MPPPREDWSPGGLGVINDTSRMAKWAVLLAAGLALLLAILAATVRFDRSVDGSAVVRPQGGTWNAQAPWHGRIARVCVEEGAVVKEGEALYMMDLQELENARASLEKQVSLISTNIAALQKQLPQAKTRGELSVKTATSDWQRFQALHNRAKVDLELAKRDHESKADLFKIGTVPEKEVKDAKAKCDKAESDLLVAEQEVLVAEQKIDVARKDATREVDQLESQVRDNTRAIEDNRHQLEEAARKIREGTILAARSGVVMRKVLSAPTMAEAGMLLATVVPQNAQTTVEVRVDASDKADVNVGERALLRFAGRTDALRGEVKAVAADAEMENGRSVYRVEVWLESVKDRLAFGLTGRATIITGRVTLVELGQEWLLQR